jgi:hypothetical protein
MSRRWWKPQPIVSLRQVSRHPCERMPMWLNQLADDIRYWLRSTSRKRHSEPFNKRKAGADRRAERRFVRASHSPPERA